MPSQTVQVQIVTYNSAATLEACLNSVHRQTYPSITVLIIDNKSTDESVAIAERYGVTVVRNHTNRGYAAAHNQGFAHALTEQVAAVLTLNPDVELADDYITQCMTVLQSATAIAGVAGKVVDAQNPAKLDTTGISINRWFQAKDRGYGELDTGQYDQETHILGVCGAAAVYSYEALQDLVTWRGYILDENFIMYKEDVEVALMAKLRGFTFRFAPKAIAKHHRGWKPGTKGSANIRVQSYLNQFSLLWTFHKRDLMYYFLNMAETARYVQVVYETKRWDQLFTPWRRVRRLALAKRRTLPRPEGSN